ncbi:MAG TPA: MlaD family protein [Gemmatimonadaceae bacterium]|nr:MlaD family protein [Gemmatimonadaceae bacterium]
MPRQRNWTDLRGGIISAVVIVLAVLATVFFARVGALHGKKVTLYVLADDGSGVLPGTEVWLAGKHSGSVKNISFRTPSNDSLGRLIITTEFLARDLPYVRRDSWAQIQAGGRLLGTPVVYVAIGSRESPALRDGDTINARAKPRALDVAGQVAGALPEVRGLLADLSTLNRQISSPVGTIGNFRTRGMGEMTDVAGTMSRITGKITTGRGTIGLVMRGDLMERASRVMSAADSARLLMSTGQGSIGRFRRDTTLMTAVQGITAELDSLRAMAGKFGGGDSSLTVALAQRRALMDSLITDIKKHPFRYISF